MENEGQSNKDFSLPTAKEALLLLEEQQRTLLSSYLGLDVDEVADEDLNTLIQEAEELRRKEVEAFGEEVVAQADVLDLEGAVKKLKIVQALRSDVGYYKEVLFAGATYLRKHLPFAFNFGFHGTTGAGKTWCSKELVYLCSHGVWVSQTTESAMMALLDDASTPAFDEADMLLKAHKNDLVEAILRMSCEPEAQYWKMEWVPGEEKEKGRWELRPRQLFAFKVLNFAKRIEPALASRTLIEELDPTKENWIIQRSSYYSDILAPVKCWLEREATRTLRACDRASIKAYILSEEMHREMGRLPSDFARDRQLGMIMLAVSHAYGWDLTSKIHQAVRSLDDYREDDLQDEVRAFLLSHGEGERKWVADLRKQFNEEYRKGERPLSSKGFGDLLAGLGVERTKDRSKGGRRFVLFTKSLLGSLLSGASGRSGGQSGDRIHRKDRMGKGGEDIEGEVLRFIKVNGGRDGVPLGALLHEFQELNPSNAKEVLAGLVDRKKVIEIRPEVFRVLGFQTAKEAKGPNPTRTFIVVGPEGHQREFGPPMPQEPPERRFLVAPIPGE